MREEAIGLSKVKLRSGSRVNGMFVLLVLGFVAVSLLADYSVNGYVSPASKSGIRSVTVSQDAVSLVTALDAALNSHDVNNALALFSDDATVVDLAGMACPINLVRTQPEAVFCQTSKIVYSNKPKIRGWLQQLIENNIELQEMETYDTTGSNVTWTISVSVDEYRRLNVAPLTVNAEAMIQDGKILILTYVLSASSTAKLATVLVSERPVVGRFMIVGAVALFVVAIFYIFRIKNTFSSIPRLEKPWIVLEGGVALLFLGVLMIAFKDLLGITFVYFEELDDSLIAVSAFFILAAMIMMKRAWTVSEGE